MAAALAVEACGGHAGSPARALWSADPGAVENPWPSDRLRANGYAGTPAGYFTQVLPDEAAYATARDFLDLATAALGSSGGYSVYAPIIVPLSARVDTAGLASGVHVFPTAGSGTDAAVDVSWSASLHALFLTPRVPFRENTSYTVAIASDRLRASSDFATSAATDPLVQAAVGRGIATAPADVDIAFSFTTQPIEDGLVAAQARIDGVLGSALTPVFLNTAQIPDYPAGIFPQGDPNFAAIFTKAVADTEGVAEIAQGTWAAFDFRGANDLFAPEYLDGSAPPPPTTVDFRLCIPEGIPPTGGWPVVITSHGLTDDSDESVARCSSFNKAGIAVLGQTAADHGFRGSVLHFFDFTRLLAVRDEFRQSQCEFFQSQRMLVNAKAQGIAPFDQLDVDHPHYWGNSLGAILGGGAIPTSSHLEASGLSVPGGRLTILFDGKAGSLLLAVFSGQIHVGMSDPHFPDFMAAFRTLAQWAVDPADPAALAPATPASRHVLLQESLHDATILNVSTENLRLAYGFPVESTPIDPFTDRGALWVWDKDQFPSVPASEDPHNLYWDLPPMRHQMETWLLSNGATLADPPN